MIGRPHLPGRRARRAARAAGGALLALSVGVGCAAGTSGGGADGAAGAAELTVFAAASLTGVAEQVAALVEEARPGTEVRLSFAGSSDLAAQVIAGAPADVLMTADEATMDRLVDAGLTDGEPVVVAENHPALVVPAGNPAGVTGLDASLDGAALVVCAPQVPCGRAAQELAGLAGITLTPVSEESAVTDVLGKVRSGQADAGIVYSSDARAAGDAVEVVPVPLAERVVNRYPAAVLAGSGEPTLARAWIAALTGEQGRLVLADAGFELP
ncbi:molybdate ABC transporter substrate-binding protein [Georgenia sp. AZ-5]|uniref:molybdate ABC transporter substrate-binding protein n=1 Tax=Georgenia sp. AZ-5 TaxID=3367526 RepID=UPI003754318F